MSRMLDEIRQQPETLARTLASELRRIEKFRALIDRRKPRLVVLAARGTSDNAAQFGRYLIEITTGIPVSLAAPSVSHGLWRAGELQRSAGGWALAIRGIDGYQPGAGAGAESRGRHRRDHE